MITASVLTNCDVSFSFDRGGLIGHTDFLKTDVQSCMRMTTYTFKHYLEAEGLSSGYLDLGKSGHLPRRFSNFLF